MNVPQLPGGPHLPTLAYLVGLILAVGLLAWIVIAWRQAQEA